MGNFKLDRDQKDKLLKFSTMTTSIMFKMIGWLGRVVNFFTKNRKLIYGVILIFILFKVGTYVVAIEPSGNYEITTSSGIVYTTNKFEVKDGCVYFERIKDGDQIIICGGATIVKSK
jgi:voltage-gated potassium channel Kch